VVDNTSAHRSWCVPSSLGANFTVHSVTKYLAGHGDVLGGVVVSDERHFEPLRALSRIVGPVLGPFESYRPVRGIKTFPLRMETQSPCSPMWPAGLARTPGGARVLSGRPAHADAAAIRRLSRPTSTAAW